MTLTQLVYPRVDVAGLEMAGSIERLGGMGYWIEAAVNFPAKCEMGLYDAITSRMRRGRGISAWSRRTLLPQHARRGSRGASAGD